MSLNKKIKQSYLPINRWETWLFSLLSATLILACTGDLENDGHALVSPSFGITIIPQNPQILKAGTQTFTATGGVTPYTYFLSNTDVGTIVPVTGVFTGVQALASAPAGTATVTAVDSTGVSGTTTLTVLPTILIVTPGSGLITAAADTVAYTATLLSGSGLATCSISRDDPSGTTTMPTVEIAAAVCTATGSAVPSSGTEQFTVTITDSINGDYATAKLTLGIP
ncbi:hypothetical protein M1N16_07145 [Nitrospinaceae bacterium]|nr:hypothetical protein [Nitrospinaceae bacterium]